MLEQSKISTLKGIGEKTEQVFHKLDVYTVADLLTYYPRDYDIFEPPVPIEELEEGYVHAVEGVIVHAPQVKLAGRFKILTVTLRGISESLTLTWYNMPYLRNTLKMGSRFIFRGKIIRKKNRLVMDQPQVFTPAVYDSQLEKMQPIYPLTSGLSNNVISKAVKQALGEMKVLKEYLPADIRSRYELAEYNFAISTIHFPEKKDDLIYARRRLVFDEFFQFILAIRKLKEHVNRVTNDFEITSFSVPQRIMEELPYELTNAQKKVWDEVKRDLGKPEAMSRLVQGDVGSGKTIIAVLALLAAAENHLQGAMMAPTEVLAKQHYESMTELLEQYGLPYRTALLVGSMTAREKREVYASIENGETDIVIGTHALIQEKVAYQNLALVITDEQHRFGVKQRETFSSKGREPHILVMSATPIPRTLAIILYGDLDISVIDELPAARKPIKNCVVDLSYRPKAYRFMEKEVSAGRQVYVICAMAEESEAVEAENVIAYADKLREEMAPGIRIEYLYGSMKPKEKNRIMEEFARNEIQVLVSTTVIEVGINVPNATVMMVENAERFGLAQLHQLRGRVGRGAHQSYCIFISGAKNKDIRKRLEILNQSNDGFYIASEDLKLRGPGDLFGRRQSGLLEFRIGDVFNDARILQEASEAAKDIRLEEHPRIQQKVANYMKHELGKINL